MNVCAIDVALNCGEPSMSCDEPDVADWAQLVQSEYFEMPGLHLTKRQMQRLWGLDEACCDAVLNALEGSGFLKRIAGDAYVRAERSV